MADPFNPAAGHLFYMADPSNPADHFFYQSPGLVDADPGTSLSGAPGADDAASDKEQDFSLRAAPSVPSVGRRDDDHELERRKKHALPVRSRENWLSYAALMVTQSAASTSSVSPDRAHGRTADTRRGGLQQPPYPPNQPFSANPHDRVRSGPHPPSCPLCGTLYQWGPSGWGSPHIPGPGDVYRHEHTRDGAHLSRCPACHCPTRTQLSPTGAPTRFLSSGRREYITGYSSQSQQYLGRDTTTSPHPTRTQLSHTGAPTSSGRQEYITGYPSQSQQYLGRDTTIAPHTTRTQLSYAGAPTSSGRREYTTGYSSQSQQYLGRHTITPPHANTNHTPLFRSSASVYGGVTTRDTSSQRHQTDSHMGGRTPSHYGDGDAYDVGTYRDPEFDTSCMYDGSRSQTSIESLSVATREFHHNAANFAPASISEGRGPAPANEQFLTGTTAPVISTPLSSANVAVTSQEGQADGADAAYSGSTNEALVSDMITKGFIKSNNVADVMRAVDSSHYVTDRAKAYSAVTHLTEQGVTVTAPHIHAAILELILPFIKAGSHVLDVGASTGLFAAMLYHRTGQDGVTIILQPSDEVVELAKQNLVADRLDQALQKGRILLVKGDEKSGYVPCAPYKVIHVTKVVEEIPPLLLTQLASPGCMVIPVRTDGHDAILQVDKDAAGNVSQKELTDLL